MSFQHFQSELQSFPETWGWIKVSEKMKQRIHFIHVRSEESEVVLQNLGLQHHVSSLVDTMDVAKGRSDGEPDATWPAPHFMFDHVFSSFSLFEVRFWGGSQNRSSRARTYEKLG